MTEVLPPRKRRVSLTDEDMSVDYKLLKSLIRDEVNLQVNRKLKEVIKPLYQVIMTDPRYEDAVTDLPEWARTLLDSVPDDDLTESWINSKDGWGL